MPINEIDMRTNKRANTLGSLRSYLGYNNKSEVKILLEKIFKVFIINQIIK
jgi:ABC-type tungstate transport system permease subunit